MLRKIFVECRLQMSTLNQWLMTRVNPCRVLVLHDFDLGWWHRYRRRQKRLFFSTAVCILALLGRCARWFAVRVTQCHFLVECHIIRHAYPVLNTRNSFLSHYRGNAPMSHNATQQQNFSSRMASAGDTPNNKVEHEINRDLKNTQNCSIPRIASQLHNLIKGGDRLRNDFFLSSSAGLSSNKLDDSYFKPAMHNTADNNEHCWKTDEYREKLLQRLMHRQHSMSLFAAPTQSASGDARCVSNTRAPLASALNNSPHTSASHRRSFIIERIAMRLDVWALTLQRRSATKRRNHLSCGTANYRRCRTSEGSKEDEPINPSFFEHHLNRVYFGAEGRTSSRSRRSTRRCRDVSNRGCGVRNDTKKIIHHKEEHHVGDAQLTTTTENCSEEKGTEVCSIPVTSARQVTSNNYAVDENEVEQVAEDGRQFFRTRNRKKNRRNEHTEGIGNRKVCSSASTSRNLKIKESKKMV